MDIGVPKSLIVFKELKYVFTTTGRRISQLKMSPNRFLFSDTSYISLGKVFLHLPTPSGKPTTLVEMDAVKADILALLSLDVLYNESLMADKVANRLTKRSFEKDNGS